MICLLLLLPNRKYPLVITSFFGNLHFLKPEPNGQDFLLHFETKLECNNDFLRPNILGNLGAGAPSFYPMKFPALPNNTPHGPFGLKAHDPAYVSSIALTTQVLHLRHTTMSRELLGVKIYSGASTTRSPIRFSTRFRVDIFTGRHTLDFRSQMKQPLQHSFR